MGVRVELCSPKNGLSEAALLLHGHFFNNQGVEEFCRRLSRLVSNNMADIKDGSVASRVFAAKDGENVVGSGEVRIYSADKLENQLLIKHDDCNIWLSKMGWELSGLRSVGLAVELAYFIVDQNYRGRGIGALIFYESLLSVLGELDCFRSSLFTIAKGIYAGSGYGQKIRDYLLEVERESNGIIGNQVVVRGVKVLLDEVEMKFGVNHECFMPKEESIATQVLAEKWGWKRLGLAKNLSPIYGLTVFLS